MCLKRCTSFGGAESSYTGFGIIFSPSQNQAFLCHWIIDRDNNWLISRAFNSCLTHGTNWKARDLRWKDRPLGVWAVTSMIINFVS